MCLLTIDLRNTVTYSDMKYPMPLGLAPYLPGVTGAVELAAMLVARLGLRGYPIDSARYIEEEPQRAGGGSVFDSLGSRAMRVECVVDGRIVVWRHDRFSVHVDAAWTVSVDGEEAQPVAFGRYMRAHERHAALAWAAHRALQGW
jgi:hypothetical protein